VWESIHWIAEGANLERGETLRYKGPAAAVV
jgi:hypothetical protein